MGFIYLLMLRGLRLLAELVAVASLLFAFMGGFLVAIPMLLLCAYTISWANYRIKVEIIGEGARHGTR